MAVKQAFGIDISLAIDFDAERAVIFLGGCTGAGVELHMEFKQVPAGSPVAGAPSLILWRTDRIAGQLIGTANALWVTAIQRQRILSIVFDIRAISETDHIQAAETSLDAGVIQSKG